MMDEIDAAINDTPPRNPIGVTECLVNFNKNIKGKGYGFVDDDAAISQGLVTEVLQKCCPLIVSLRKDGIAPWAKLGHGQGGFLRRALIKRRPGGGSASHYSVYPVTAKHNLRKVTHKATNAEFIPAEAKFSLGDTEILVTWDELGWTNTATDSFDLRLGTDARPALTDFGFDVSVGRLFDDTENPSCVAHRSFDRIGMSKDKLKKGMKVGMAVLFTEEGRPTRDTIARDAPAPSAYTEEKIKLHFGEPGSVNIYTGEILYVGEKHIEYNINSFTGCSGAIVFVLDQQQPRWVEKADWGKAIAVHSGGHPTLLDRNYGFLINEHNVFKNL